MSITDRFSEVLSSIEFQLARSLPVYNDKKESIFFYKVKEISEMEYEIVEIKYVIFRDMVNGKVKKLNAEEILPKTLLNNIKNQKSFHTMSVEEELKKEDSYLEYYERVINNMRRGNMSTDAEISCLSTLYQSLVRGTGLDEVYEFLGKELIDCLK